MKTQISSTQLPADSLDYSMGGLISSVRRGRYFFVTMSVLFLLIAVIGFIPSYQGVYTGGLKFHWFAHVHGAIMTSWLVLFLTQSLLAARNNRNGGKLYLQLPDIPKLKLGATADTALFVKTTVWNLSFTKGADGQVSQLTNTREPLVWKVPKMKQP